jgi:hypothetical protein
MDESIVLSFFPFGNSINELVGGDAYSISPLLVLGLRLVLVVVAVLIGIRIAFAPARSDLLEKRSTL